MTITPFWPTSVACTNVLCVPVANVRAERFTQILELFISIQEVRLADVKLADAKQSGTLTVSLVHILVLILVRLGGRFKI